MSLSRERVESALDEIRPALHMDGGDCEVVGVDDREGLVTLRLVGACGGCPMSTRTLKSGIERIVRTRLPEVQEIQTLEAF